MERIKSIFCIIVGLLLIFLAFGAKKSDKEFYENAKVTKGTVKAITTEKKTRYKKVGKRRRAKTVTQYNADITYDEEQNGIIVSQTVKIKDVSSSLKQGDVIDVYYLNGKTKIKSKEQSNLGNNMMFIPAVIFLIVGIIGFYGSKSKDQDDELSGNDNIYSNHKDYY